MKKDFWSEEHKADFLQAVFAPAPKTAWSVMVQGENLISYSSLTYSIND